MIERETGGLVYSDPLPGNRKHFEYMQVGSLSRRSLVSTLGIAVRRGSNLTKLEADPLFKASKLAAYRLNDTFIVSIN